MLSLSTSDCPGKKVAGCREGLSLPVNSYGKFAREGEPYARKLLSFSGFDLAGQQRLSKPQLRTKKQSTGKRAQNSSKKRDGSPEHAFRCFSEENLFVHILKTGPTSVVFPESYLDRHNLRRNRRGLRRSTGSQGRERIGETEKGEVCAQTPLQSPGTLTGLSF